MSDKNLPAMHSREISVIPSKEEWGTIYNMAKALLPTGFLPNSIKTAEQATAIMLKGRELNVPPMYSLSNIVIVQGKPTVSAEMMLALVQRDHGIEAMWVEESTNDYCKVGYRSGNGKKFYTFSMEDAKRANLTKNPVWSQYPAAMCRARAISAVARMAFPGSIGGMYVPGELGDPVTVDDEGEVLSTYVDDTPAGRMRPERINTMTGEVHDDVDELARKRADLLDNPEPGLHTWQEALAHVSQKLTSHPDYDPGKHADPRSNTQEPRRATQATVEVSEPVDDEDDRVGAMKDLLTVANDNGYTDDDVELYFELAGIDPETVTVERMIKIRNGIEGNPVAFGETVEKAKAMRELNPSADELGA